MAMVYMYNHYLALNSSSYPIANFGTILQNSFVYYVQHKTTKINRRCAVHNTSCMFIVTVDLPDVTAPDDIPELLPLTNEGINNCNWYICMYIDTHV